MCLFIYGRWHNELQSSQTFSRPWLLYMHLQYALELYYSYYSCLLILHSLKRRFSEGSLVMMMVTYRSLGSEGRYHGDWFFISMENVQYRVK